MPRVASWISVEPSANPAAILGPLPFVGGEKVYPLPASVVPPNAEGILIFAWAALAGVNTSLTGGKAPLAYWHFASALPDGSHNWFSLIVAGNSVAGGGVQCNSQAFWLPMPRDRCLRVTLTGGPLSSPVNQGEVEIHGYYPAQAAT